MQFFHGGGDGLAYDTLAAPIVSQDGQLYKAYSYFPLYSLCKVKMTGIGFYPKTAHVKEWQTNSANWKYWYTEAFLIWMVTL